MKLIKQISFLLAALIIFSCSSDENSTNEGNSNGFAMTAKVDGQLYEMNNPFGSDHAVTSIFSYYPDDEFIQLQGRNGVFGNPEINLWFKRTDLKLGTYQVDENTDGITTHIDLIDSSNSIFENTVLGSITIDFIDTNNKIVKGTFQFTAKGQDFPNPEVTIQVTEGTFNFRYDVDY